MPASSVEFPWPVHDAMLSDLTCLHEASNWWSPGTVGKPFLLLPLCARRAGRASSLRLAWRASMQPATVPPWSTVVALVDSIAATHQQPQMRTARCNGVSPVCASPSLCLSHAPCSLTHPLSSFACPHSSMRPMIHSLLHSRSSTSFLSLSPAPSQLVLAFVSLGLHLNVCADFVFSSSHCHEAKP